jgi:hypothetical protein
VIQFYRVHKGGLRNSKVEFGGLTPSILADQTSLRIGRCRESCKSVSIRGPERWQLEPPAVSLVMINKSTRSLLCNSISDQQVNRAWNWKGKN